MLPVQFEKGIPGFDMVTVLVLLLQEHTSKERGRAAFAGVFKGQLGVVVSAAVLGYMLSTAIKAAASPFEPLLGIVV